MVLNIYKRGNKVKTYKIDNYELTYGTVEDVFNTFNLDSMKYGTKEELSSIIIKSLPSMRDLITPLMLDMFDGLTEEELRNTKISEITSIILEVVRYSLEEMGKGFSNGKK